MRIRTAGCAERVLLALDAYEEIRLGATHFALLDGYQNPAVEDVVRRGDGYLVVANYGAAATTTRRTDPRASSR